MTLRPLTSTAKNLRTRVVSAQFSANSRRSHEPSFCGARPQYTAVGTSSTSRTGIGAQRLDQRQQVRRRTARCVASQKRRRRPTSK